jgi:drug/metabolite transporter (DMT)-like permease
MLSAEATPPPMQPTRLGGGERLAIAAALGQTTIAVATSFIARATLRAIEPWTLILLRLAAGSVVTTLLVLPRRPWRLPRRDLWQMAGLGVLGVTINQTCFLRGLSESTPARTSLLYALTPLLVLIMAWLRGIERLSPRGLAGILTAFTGVALILSQRPDLAGTSIRGDLIVLVGVVSWAGYSALGKEILARHDVFVVTAVGLIAGTLAFVPFGLLPASLLDPGAVPLWAWGGVAFMATGSSIVAYVLWYYAIQRLPPSRVAIFMNLQPPLVVVVSWVLFDEPITAVFLAGAALVLAGVRLAVRSN